MIPWHMPVTGFLVIVVVLWFVVSEFVRFARTHRDQRKREKEK